METQLVYFQLMSPACVTECLKALGHMKEAAESYTKVVEMAPLHLEARLSLATVQQQLGRMDCALKALESMYDSDTLAQDSSAAQKVSLCSLDVFCMSAELGMFLLGDNLRQSFPRTTGAPGCPLVVCNILHVKICLFAVT